jgi:dTDP-4-amino-4,6-dideoxygalactose transaminase
MIPIPLVDLTSTHDPVRDQLHAALDRALCTSAFTGGEEVEGFERELAQFVGTRHSIGVASGTAALTVALLAAGIGRGDEVILPPNTFFATAGAVLATGATPVLADVDPETALLDPDAVDAAITPRTAAVIPVHLYGQPVDGDRFAALAARHGLFVLEDACQALGGSWDGRAAGTLGHAAAFSFYPSKNLGALGDGGAVTTDDDELARRIRMLRNHGQSTKDRHDLAGLCERLDALQAAFLRVKLARFGEDQRMRVATAAHCLGRLHAVPGVDPLHTAERATHAHHLMVVRVERRDDVMATLRASGIAAAVHYPTPIHLQPATAALGAVGQFPVAEELAESILTLPLWPGMDELVVERIVDATRAAVGGPVAIHVGASR